MSNAPLVTTDPSPEPLTGPTESHARDVLTSALTALKALYPGASVVVGYSIQGPNDSVKEGRTDALFYVPPVHNFDDSIHRIADMNVLAGTLTGLLSAACTKVIVTAKAPFSLLEGFFSLAIKHGGARLSAHHTEPYAKAIGYIEAGHEEQKQEPDSPPVPPTDPLDH